MLVQTSGITALLTSSMLLFGSTYLSTTLAQRSDDVPVTTTIADAINGTPMQIQSDGAGAYLNTRYVESIVQGAAADWELDTNYSKFSTRNVWLDFTKPIPGTGPSGGDPIAPFTAGLAKVRFISKCHLYGVNMFTIPVGTTVNCPLATGFHFAESTYRLHMNPVTGVDVNPETDVIDITCNAARSFTFRLTLCREDQ